MTTTIIRKSTTSTTGYEIVFDNQILPLNDRPKNEPFTLILPENPSNRKYFNSKKVDAAGGEIELTYKETRHLGERTSTSTSTPKTPKTDRIREYLTDEEKAIYDELIKKAQRRIERAALIAEIENLQKALADTEEV